MVEFSTLQQGRESTPDLPTGPIIGGMKSSIHRSRKLLCLLFLLALSFPSVAWNAAGHRLIAQIAWQRLDESSRAAIGKLLHRHPDYQHWQTQGLEDDKYLNAFVEASTWPDDIRKDARFYSAGEAPTPTLAGFPDMERRRHWHYVDRPIPSAGRYPPSDGTLDVQLAALLDTLSRRHTPTVERVYALPWLIHLVGDAHQPLHVASRYSVDGRGDRGGNELTIDNPFATAHDPADNLHRYWDGLPGAPWLRGERLMQRAEALMQRYPPNGHDMDQPGSTPTQPFPPHPRLLSHPEKAGEDELLRARCGTAWPGSPSQWLLESWRIAERDAYPPGNAAVPTISAEFDARSKEIARQRIVLAGYRLAGLLQCLLRSSGLR